MGCWNKTCGLSNLHITAGEQAYVFVLEKNKDASDHCYATHLYSPLLLPFVTEYDDYGGGENSTGPGFPIIMEAIKQQLHEMELGENKYHDIAVTKESFGERLFFEAVHEGRLFRENHYGEPSRVEYVMFRKDVVDYILENRVIERYVGDGKGTCGWDNNYIQYKFADIVADILPMLKEMLEQVEKAREEGVTERMLFRLLGGIEYMFDYGHPNLAVKWLRGDNYRYSRIVDMKQVFSKMFENPSEESVLDLEALLTEYLKGLFIDSFMEVTRKSWIPAGHEGSQSQERDEYRLLIAATEMVLDAEEEKYAAEYEEE